MQNAAGLGKKEKEGTENMSTRRGQKSKAPSALTLSRNQITYLRETRAYRAALRAAQQRPWMRPAPAAATSATSQAPFQASAVDHKAGRGHSWRSSGSDPCYSTYGTGYCPSFEGSCGYGGCACTVLGFAPSGGPPGSTVTIFGGGFDSTIAVVFGGGVSTAAFAVVSSTVLTVTVPAGALSGPIMVITATSCTPCTSPTSFIVCPGLCTVTATPMIGPVGSSVTLTGTGFVGVSRVTFGATMGVASSGTSASFTVVSSTEITTTVPAGAMTGLVSVTTPCGTCYTVDPFVVCLGCHITSFTPTIGAVNTTVVITGTNLANVSEVTFNGTGAMITFANATTIDTLVPNGATSGYLTVTTPCDVCVSNTVFTVCVPCTITGFMPTSGPAGTNVVIMGTGLATTSEVSFNGAVSNHIVVLSNTEVAALVPPEAPPGTGPIFVTTDCGTCESTANFTVNCSNCTITGFMPTSGAVNTNVTITGTNFFGVPQTGGVYFGTTPAIFYTVASSTEIYANVPSPPIGNVYISVVTSCDTCNSAPAEFMITSPP